MIKALNLKAAQKLFNVKYIDIVPVKTEMHKISWNSFQENNKHFPKMN